MTADPTDTLNSPQDAIAAVMASVGGQLAAATGMVKSVAELVSKLTDTTDQFARVMARVSPGATPADAAATVPMPDANTNVALSAYPPDPSRGPGPWAPPVPVAARKPNLAVAADAAEAAFQERKATQGGGPLGEVAATLHDILDAARLILTALRPPTQQQQQPDRLPVATPASWFARLRSQAAEAVGRVGRRALGRRGYTAVTRGAGAMRAALSAGTKTAAGRGVASGVVFGAVGGARAGAAVGPAGAVAGMVAGVVASAGKSLFDAGTGVFTQLAGSITRHLTPVALVSQAIQSSTSGYSVFQKAVGLLASTVGVVLLPLFLSLAAATLWVADQLRGPLADAAKQLSGPVFDQVREGMAALVTAVQLAVAALEAVPKVLEGLAAGLFPGADKLLSGAMSAVARNPVGAASGVAAGLADGLAPTGGGVGALLEQNRRKLGLPSNDPPAGVGKASSAALGGASAAAESAGGEGGGRSMADLLQLAVREFEHSLGGRAENRSLDDIGRSAQLAGLNMSPFEQELLKIQREALAVARSQVRPPEIVRAVAVQ